jgi:putative transcriptional regulator
MPITWNLQRWLESERGVKSATDISRAILKNTGFKITSQAIADLFNAQPKMLRLETLQAICDTYRCRLSDFCLITPHDLPSTPPQFTNTETITNEEKIARLRALSADLEQLRRQLGLIAPSDASGLSGNTLNSLIDTGQIRQEPLLGHIYVYKHEIQHWKERQPSSYSPIAIDPTPIVLSLHSYSVQPNENLRSFIARVQLSAVDQAITIEGTLNKAAQRLHYGRSSISTLHKRLKSNNRTSILSNPDRQPSSQDEILLPRKLFVIKKTEGLQTFVARIKLATITRTVELKGNKTRAADRLGYRRTALQTLLRQLTLGLR